MTKTICLFAANYLPNLGGVERYVYNLSKKLLEYGNKVIVVTSNVYNLPSYEVIEGIEIYRFPCFNILKGRFPVLKYNKECIRLTKRLLNNHIDLIIVNTRFYLHSYFGVKLAQKHNIKCFVIEHGTNHFTVNNFILDKLGHIYEHFITKLVAHNCQTFYGVSKSCVDWLHHFSIAAQEEPIYNAVNLENINYLLNNPVEDYRSKYGIGKSDIIISYTGRLVAEKGILKLIEAFKQLRESFSNIHLFIAGNGDLFDRVKSISADSVIVLGKIDFASVIALLGQTDIFCLPTDYPEGFPTSVLEAVGSKCCVVTTEAGGSKELIIDRKHGIIMKYNSVEEICESLKCVIINEDYRKECIDNSYNRLCKKFTWDIVTTQLMDIIDNKSTKQNEYYTVNYS